MFHIWIANVTTTKGTHPSNIYLFTKLDKAWKNESIFSLFFHFFQVLRPSNMLNSTKVINNDTTDTLSPTLQPRPTHSHTHLQPKMNSASLSLPAHPPAVTSLSLPVQPRPDEDLIALSQEIFAALETTNANISAEIHLTPAQKERF